MLVLRRKVGESIVVNERITITINRIEGNRVSLGIEAPLEDHILRGELDKDPEQPQAATPPIRRPSRRPRRGPVRVAH